jgi:hypothetical protein
MVLFSARKRGQTVRLTAKMVTALAAGASAWDRSLSGVDGRTLRGLITRGLVDVTMGTHSYYSQRKGWWVTRSVITDVKINSKGRAALALAEGC